jgi:DNA invertase Pin-like site-specific DNA recombinase
MTSFSPVGKSDRWVRHLAETFGGADLLGLPPHPVNVVANFKHCPVFNKVMRRRKMQIAQNRKTVAYVRVSTEDQAREGVSLDAQEARIAAYCAAMGWGVPEVICDAAESAKSLQRPEIAKAIADLCAGGIERVVVLKLDRLTRSVRDLADLIDLFAKHEVALVSVGETLDTSTAAGRMVMNMLGVVAQWEREAIAERTSTALGYKRQRRQVYGHVPFGWRREGNKLVEVPVEQDALTEMGRMDAKGATLRSIGEMLETRGLRPRRGERWAPATVRPMLRSRIAQEAAA